MKIGDIVGHCLIFIFVMHVIIKPDLTEFARALRAELHAQPLDLGPGCHFQRTSMNWETAIPEVELQRNSAH